MVGRSLVNDPQDIGGDRRRLDPGILQELVQTVGLARSVPDEYFAVTREVLSSRIDARWYEAAPQQPVLQQCAIHTQSCTSVLRPGT